MPEDPPEQTIGQNPGIAGPDPDTQAYLNSIATAERLERILAGPLPCVVCRYDLRGISIRGLCPECGTAIRATILARVDPRAAELTPIRYPWLVALGLVVWVGGMLLAVLACWFAALVQIIVNWSTPTPMPGFQEQWGLLVALLIWTAGLGALCICRPHRLIPRWMTACILLGAALHVPMGILALKLGTIASHATGGWQVDTFWEPAPDRTLHRWSAWVLGLLIIVLIRPVARALVARSLAIRTGRVDRQTMVAIAAAVAVVFLGDGLGLASVGSGMPYTGMGTAGAAMVLIGSILLTLGLLGGLVDAVRIARSVITPGPSLDAVLTPAGLSASLAEGAKV